MAAGGSEGASPKGVPTLRGAAVGDDPTEAWRERDEEGPAALVGQTLGGRYILIEVVGTGGMGTVYRGRHVIIERPVAVKVLSRQFSVVKDVRERFYREARIATRIRHPNVLDVIDLGETETELLYLVMELLDGETLASRLAKSGPLPFQSILDVFIEACDGLGAAHEVGIIHRDISPSNLFLVAPGQQTGRPVRVKILDFGIAFMKSEPRITKPGQVLGTPYYIAPEAVRGEAATVASDVYSLGATIYEATCGSPPFEADSYADILMMHMTDDPPPLGERREGVPPKLWDLVAACLRKQPRERPGGMRDVAQALEEVRRDMAGRARKSFRPPVGPAGAPEAQLHAVGSGLTAWKEYLKNVIGRSAALGPDRRRRVHEMESAVEELETLDAELADRKDELTKAEERATSGQARFARALETMRAEEARLQAEAVESERKLAEATAARDAAEAAFAELRSKVSLIEGLSAASAPAGEPRQSGASLAPAGASRPEDEMVEAYAAAGAAAAALREARTAQRAARRERARWEDDMADVWFQIDRLVAASQKAQESTALEAERRAIRALEERRAAIWSKLIDLASAISHG